MIMTMNININAKKQDEMVAHTKTITADIERLANHGFITEEIVSLLWLQKWYQMGGSDRIELLRHWEFLQFLVFNGKLDT